MGRVWIGVSEEIGECDGGERVWVAVRRRVEFDHCR